MSLTSRDWGFVRALSALGQIAGLRRPRHPRRRGGRFGGTSEVTVGPADQLPYTTVRIAADLTGGRSSVGTAFFFNFAADGHTYPALVTNKHVIAGSTQATLRVHVQGADGEPHPSDFVNIGVDKFEGQWILHPDAEVDLAVAMAGPILNDVRAKLGKTPFFRAFDESMLAPPGVVKALTPIEDVLMVGYPIGIWDSVNNRPIIRRGITATDFKRDYEGRTQFLIDAACFPGSSGSPVILWNMGMYQSGAGMTLGTRIHLLGVLYAGPQFTTEGQLVVKNIPTAAVPVVHSSIPTNLGFAVKAHRILDFKPIIAKQFNIKL